MEKLSDITLSIESKFAKLIQHLDKTVKENELLREKLLQNQTELNDLQEKHRLLEQNFSDLKIVNSLLGSEDFKKETKHKINSLVKEIDHCIMQLSQIKD